ncbi:MAG: hypothetical protein PHS04_00365 [Tissierellia bacterium]|nr:hypothetical protein [Tissierellia bacterium]
MSTQKRVITMKNLTLDSPFDKEMFSEVDMSWSEDDKQIALHTNLGSLTVLDRLTGFGWRDVETGYRDPDGNFWLASGNQDVTRSNVKTIGEAIKWVKERANTCIGDKHGF